MLLGLIYEFFKDGIGEKVMLEVIVQVNYCGMLVNGIEFDSFYKCGQLVSFLFNWVILCWMEGVVKMCEGGKVKLICLFEIVYGLWGVGLVVLLNVMLIFEVELFKVMC